ncbi:MAG: hypothetical protein COC03_02120 [Robiginitomaculum sp.]|nr:MAG: hypothetical protein COC03_02120 [Robiginitomaculum sp.]PHQ68075.1 MAG: hypothetical protein COB92_01940 [Robiginitomaculum sp.]
MAPLNSKYTGILWVNVLILAAGIGGMVWYKWHNVMYAAGAGLGIGVVEYIFMRVSLSRKQQKEQDKNK